MRNNSILKERLKKASGDEQSRKALELDKLDLEVKKLKDDLRLNRLKKSAILWGVFFSMCTLYIKVKQYILAV